MQYSIIELRVRPGFLRIYQQPFFILLLACFLEIYFLLQQDTNDIRIAQWLNQTTENKILQLSHKLNSEAAEGSYQIRAEVDGNQVQQWFKVEKYGRFYAMVQRRPPFFSSIQSRNANWLCLIHSFA